MTQTPDAAQTEAARQRAVENALDAHPEKTRKMLEEARAAKAVAERKIALCEASLHRTGASYIGQEAPETLSYETRLLHMTELCEAAVGNMKSLMERLTSAGRPGMADYYQEFADNIKREVDREFATLMKGPHGRFLREAGVKVPETDAPRPDW